MTPLRFNRQDYDRAKREWRCSCVPVAVAAVLDRTLDDTRRFFPNFQGFATDDMLTDALNLAGRWWRTISPEFCPRPGWYGLVRLRLGVGRFHLIATWNDGSRIMAIDSASLSWIELGVWKKEILPTFKPSKTSVCGVLEVVSK